MQNSLLIIQKEGPTATSEHTAPRQKDWVRKTRSSYSRTKI
jgi:hypothetical protein